jgi:hypothetical protein
MIKWPDPLRRSITPTEAAVHTNLKNRHKGVHLGLDPVGAERQRAKSRQKETGGGDEKGKEEWMHARRLGERCSYLLR